MNIDIKQYTALKTAGTIQLMRVTDKTFNVVCRQFNPFTGEELDPAVSQVNIDEITTSRDAAQANLDGLNSIIDDMNALAVGGVSAALKST